MQQEWKQTIWSRNPKEIQQVVHSTAFRLQLYLHGCIALPGRCMCAFHDAKKSCSKRNPSVEWGHISWEVFQSSWRLSCIFCDKVENVSSRVKSFVILKTQHIPVCCLYSASCSKNYFKRQRCGENILNFCGKIISREGQILQSFQRVVGRNGKCTALITKRATSKPFS